MKQFKRLNQRRSGEQTRKRSSEWFAKLSGNVEAYTLEQVSEIIWIPEDKIWEATKIYAEMKPAVSSHRVGIEHNVNATQTGRTLNTPPVLTGIIDLKEGGYCGSIQKGTSRFPPLPVGANGGGRPETPLCGEICVVRYPQEEAFVKYT